jgi:DNA-binding CsgD family transcriptional regulator/tetratricopeptide (TPR) repeat protein
MIAAMEAGVAEGLIRDGWTALAEADWDAARSCFERAGELEQTAEILDGLGRALHFQGNYPQAIAVTERAFAAYRKQGKPVDAADRARWLAFLHGAINSNMAVAGGWMERAASLLEGAEECAGHGWLVLDRAPFTDDAEERRQLATAALAIARRFGDVDLEYDALSLLGESCVAAGRVGEGMKLLDQAMTAVSAGEVVGVVPVGDIYCRLLSACEIALDVARAEEWMSVAGSFGAWSDFVSPVCRTHYGGILIAIGRWGDAEEQLLAALHTFEGSYRGMSGWPLGKLADLRVRQGRFDEARRMTEGHESHPAARRVLAAVALGRGEIALAEELVGLCLESEAVADPRCAPVLEMLVQIRIARDDMPAAGEALERLGNVATASRDDVAAAFAELAAGRVRSAERAESAPRHLQSALRGFTALQLPLEAARAQRELARALADIAPEAAVAEARLALRAFEQIGATADADATAALLRRVGASGRAFPKHFGELTKRETEVLALLAEGCSNDEIARRLVISRRTAEHHVAHILSKLGLRSRAEATAHALRERSEDP